MFPKELLEEKTPLLELMVEEIDNMEIRKLFNCLSLTKTAVHVCEIWIEQLSKKSAENIQAVLTLDSQNAKRQYFLASKCGFDYFVRDSKGVVFGETERKNGFTIKHENMPERLVEALKEKCDFLDVVSRDTRDLALYLQKHYKAIYLSDEQQEEMRQMERLHEVFSKLTNDDKEEIINLLNKN